MTTRQRLRITRRHFFDHAFGQAAGFGIGSAALATLVNQEIPAQARLPYVLNFVPKAKSVIYLQQCGGPPHIDMFDYKPALEKWNGQPTPESLIKGERFAFITGLLRFSNLRLRFGDMGNREPCCVICCRTCRE